MFADVELLVNVKPTYKRFSTCVLKLLNLYISPPAQSSRSSPLTRGALCVISSEVEAAPGAQTSSCSYEPEPPQAPSSLWRPGRPASTLCLRLVHLSADGQYEAELKCGFKAVLFGNWMFFLSDHRGSPLCSRQPWGRCTRPAAPRPPGGCWAVGSGQPQSPWQSVHPAAGAGRGLAGSPGPTGEQEGDCGSSAQCDGR